MKWIRVDSGERPEDGEEIKVKVEHDGAPKGYLERRVVYSSEHDDFWPYWDAVTHWAHLPEPPEREE